MLAPLAERMRPQSLEQYIGQEAVIGMHSPLRRFILNRNLPSLIFWGPPGVGKTTLARLLAKELAYPILTINAVQSGVREIREAIEFGKQNANTVVFIDEIHRFNKSQQDSLLNAVETGTITLIGATTENPSFEVIASLLSRCQTFVLKSLTPDEIRLTLEQAIKNDIVLQKRKIDLKEWDVFYKLSNGDARRALNILELCVNVHPENETLLLTNSWVSEVVQTKVALYDKNGEEHYNIISAFIKSVRGSDPNAALYWLARMIDGGETVRFIARRMIILASEDIGNANPNALLLATSTAQAVEIVGLPEARIILAQCATYLASSLKSNAAYVGIEEALKSVRTNINLSPPKAILNAPTQLMKNMGYGENYKYSHDFDVGEAAQEYLPSGLEGTTFYRPKNIGKEKEIKAYLKTYWKDKYTYE